MLRPNSRASNN